MNLTFALSRTADYYRHGGYLAAYAARRIDEIRDLAALYGISRDTLNILIPRLVEEPEYEIASDEYLPEGV